LGGNRVSYKRWLLNIFLVFVISGLWHGANLTFVIWGALHGLVFITETILSKKFPSIKIPAFFGHFYLLMFHTLSLIAFRANCVNDLSFIYQKIFSAELFSLNMHNLEVIQDKFYYLLMIWLIVILFIKELNEEYGWINRHPFMHKVLKPVIYLAFIIAVFVFGNFNANTFIYFQF
jgi:D-alanyl-lipoteichoic acid acyltransferase DltB (MBOAT superfamily)